MPQITVTVDYEDQWSNLPSLNEISVAYFDFVCEAYKGNRSDICRTLGISRSSYHRWINVDQGNRVRAVSLIFEKELENGTPDN